MKKYLMAAISALLFSGVVLAEPPKFEAADTNADGGVNVAEFKATGIEREFAKLDQDGNGQLNKDEYAAALEEDCE